MTEPPAILIRIAASLRPYTGGAEVVVVNGECVADALIALGRQHPGILERVLDDHGQLRQFINVYLGAANIRTLEGLGTSLEADDILAILPAAAGSAF
ncbi:MAG TPA: MoaD/ThiS family protein [Rhodocyclaceae bacterium]|nr:MoaD/ThiS family protein [Rhodocyclaceae bacterium]